MQPDFQTLGGMLMRNDSRLRASPAQIVAGAAPQSALWALGISGDLPIVLLRIDDAADISALHQAISAHEYWQMHQQAVDLVILNDRTSSYVQDLQIAIESAVRAARSRPRASGIHAPVNGTIHAVADPTFSQCGGTRAPPLPSARIDPGRKSGATLPASWGAPPRPCLLPNSQARRFPKRASPPPLPSLSLSSSMAPGASIWTGANM